MKIAITWVSSLIFSQVVCSVASFPPAKTWRSQQTINDQQINLCKISPIGSAVAMCHPYPQAIGFILGSQPAARPVHPISTDSGELWGRSSGEVHFICQEIEVEKCYGDLQKLPEKSIVVDGGLNLGIFSFWAMRSDQGCADSLKCLLHKQHATFPMTKRMLDETTTIFPV